MADIDHLLTLVSAYSVASGLSEGTVSARFLGGGAVARELREGRDMGARRVQRVIEAFSARWPADAPWPEGVERPVLTPTLSRTGEGAESVEAGR